LDVCYFDSIPVVNGQMKQDKRGPFTGSPSKGLGPRGKKMETPNSRRDHVAGATFTETKRRPFHKKEVTWHKGT